MKVSNFLKIATGMSQNDETAADVHKTFFPGV
jgi:hypothetical protein